MKMAKHYYNALVQFDPSQVNLKEFNASTGKSVSVTEF
jgi:hypothetical protein